METHTLTLERLNEVLRFDVASNNWYWKKPTAHKMKPNDIAGGMRKRSNLRYICIDKKQYSADKLLHFLHNNGTWPPSIVREKKQRVKKQGPRKLGPVYGAVPYRGIYFHTDKKRYVAKFSRKVNGKRIEKWIGLFDDPLLASLAYERFAASLQIGEEVRPKGKAAGRSADEPASNSCSAVQ
jgi:hypothetical protein